MLLEQVASYHAFNYLLIILKKELLLYERRTKVKDKNKEKVISFDQMKWEVYSTN